MMSAFFSRFSLAWYSLALLVILLDQWTKQLAVSLLDYGRPVEVLPVLNMTLQYNAGAAFSFLSGAGGWQRWFFAAVALVVSVVLVVWISRLKRTQWMLALALALILGGALGNLWDRLLLGYVVDFISAHWQSRYFFPAFNIADAAISVGAVLLLLDMFINPEHHDSKDKKANG